MRNIQFREGALFLDLSGTDLQVLERLRGWFNNHRSAQSSMSNRRTANENGVQIRLKLTPVAA